MTRGYHNAQISVIDRLPPCIRSQNTRRIGSCIKKLIATIALIFAVLLPVSAGSERLAGTWKSNKAATLDYLKKHTKLTPQQLEKLDTILGKTVFIFDAQNVTLKSGDWKFVSKYKILEESKDLIVIESDDPQTRKPTKTRIELDAKGFWTPDDKIAGYKERFDKIVGE
jgi:hypothetical protein